jgi:hypothetical protein
MIEADAQRHLLKHSWVEAGAGLERLDAGIDLGQLGGIVREYARHCFSEQLPDLHLGDRVGLRQRSHQSGRRCVARTRLRDQNLRGADCKKYDCEVKNLCFHSKKTFPD